MGVITQGILGAISGRVGPVVGGSWKGIAYLRGYQGSVAQPNTAAQVAQKERMRVIVSIAKLFLAVIIKPLTDRFAVRMSGYNLFVSRNIEFVSGAGVPSFPDFIFSAGTLTAFENLQAVNAAGATRVDFSWLDNSGTGTAQATDEVYMACINTTQGTTGQVGGAAKRGDLFESADLSAPTNSGDVIETYSSYRSASGFAVSNSEYIQVITP
jgi:hypothetical protein